MKKDYMKWIAVFLVFSFVLGTVFIFDSTVYADPMTAYQIGAAANAIMQSAGMGYFGSVSSMTNYFTGQVNRYLDGRSITEVFGSEVLRTTAGKLVIPATLYNNIKGFISWLNNENGIDTTTELPLLTLSYGTINGYPVYNLDTAFTSATATALPALYPFNEASSGYYACNYSVSGGYVYVSQYVNGVSRGSINHGRGDGSTLQGWQLITLGQVSTTSVRIAYYWRDGSTFKYSAFGSIGSLTSGQIDVNVDNTGYDPIDDLQLGQNWVGDLGAAPDTNLEQLLLEIFQQIQDRDIDIDATVESDQPVPTPVPTYSPVDDVLDGINTGIEIGNDIITGQAEQTGAIEQGFEGVQDSVESLEGTIAEAISVPDEQEAEEFKFDLRTLFPFCIPFDIYNMLRAFDGIAVAPHYRIPIVIQSIGFAYTMDLDFAMFDSVAAVLRQVELIVFGVALAYATSKVIRW